MRKNFRTVKASLIISIVLFSTLFAITPTSSAKLITYEAVLEMDYDESAVNEAVFQPDGPPVSIPISLRFKAEVPPAFLSSIPLRILFLQTFIITSAQIRLSVINNPDWAAISITNPTPYVEIDSEFATTQTSIVIAAHDDAPAEGFSLKIKAETDQLLNKHVPAKEAYMDIVFQPGYIPLIDVYTEDPSRVVGPQETVTFPVRITNLGNKQTIVTAKIIDYPENWSPLLSQAQIIIPSAEGAGENNVGYLSFSITPPYDLGWHNDLETITLEFTPEFSPPQANRSRFVGTSVPFQVTIRSRGFSTPGFETVGLLFAAVILIALFKKRK